MKTGKHTIFTSILLFLLIGCSAQPQVDLTLLPASPIPVVQTPTRLATQLPSPSSPIATPTIFLSPTPVPSTTTPTKTSTPTMIPPTPSATATLVPVENPLTEWPLTVGDFWVYVSINIDLDQQATYIMTDTVKRTEIVSGYFVVMIQRTGQFVYGDNSIHLSYSVYRGNYWYIVSQLDDTYHVYLQRELDLNGLESSWLKYQFPLKEGICWDSDPDTAKLMDCNTNVKSYGFQNLSTGEIIDCYSIQVVTFVGMGSSLFCPGVGIAKNLFRMNSNTTTSPLRYEEILIDYGHNP